MILQQKDIDRFLKAKEKIGLPPLPPEAEWDSEPPPYLQSSGGRALYGNSLIPVATPAPLRPTNHLKIHRPTLSVKGTWLIDSSLRIPQSFLDPLPQGETIRPNLNLSSDYSAVHAEVYVQGTQRAMLVVKSSSSAVSIRVPRRTQNVCIVAKSKYNSVEVFLPDDFCGPIHWKIKYHTVKFSSAVQQSLTLFGQNKADGVEHGFVGEYIGSGYGETDEAWKGDEAHAEASLGRHAKFYFASETKKLEKHRFRHS